MTDIDLPRRTREFSRRVIIFVRTFSAEPAARVISYQLIRAATSVGANYAEAGYASSRKDFINKITLSTKECAEALYWIRLCLDVRIGASGLQEELSDEANQLLSILVAIARNAKRNNR